MVEPTYISRIDFLQNFCKGKKVLHLGCSSGRYIEDRIARGDLLHAVLEKVALDIFGIDIDKNSLETMRRFGFERLYYGDVENLEEVEMREEFDVVVAGDLLEHISRPGSMLEGIKLYLGKDGLLIISTNNAFGLHYQIKRWTGKYQEHHEHVAFYSPETLLNLFERHSYKVLKIYGAYTVPPFSLKQKVLFFIGSPLFRLFPVLAGTLVVIAKRTDI